MTPNPKTSPEGRNKGVQKKILFKNKMERH
jgi:hypothetical protein